MNNLSAATSLYSKNEAHKKRLSVQLKAFQIKRIKPNLRNG